MSTITKTKSSLKTATSSKSTYLMKTFSQSNATGLSEAAQKWLEDNQIEEDPQSWEYADKVTEALAKDSKGSVKNTNLKESNYSPSTATNPYLGL